MPIYITQGRYTRDAVKGMIINPEDRAAAVKPPRSPPRASETHWSAAVFLAIFGPGSMIRFS